MKHEGPRKQQLLRPGEFKPDPLLPLSHTPPEMSAISTVLPSTGQLLAASRKPAVPLGRQAFLKRPLVQALAGLAVGMGFLVLVSRLVDVPRTIHLIQQHVTTTHGLVFALLASLSLRIVLYTIIHFPFSA